MMRMTTAVWVSTAMILLAGCSEEPTGPGPRPPRVADARLGAVLDSILRSREFTGRIEGSIEARLGRAVDGRLADLGRYLFFDPILSLSGDNSCSGCHAPNASFNDSKSISIGVGNNGIVGPGRAGPYNLRAAPTVVNTALYPRLMWDARFIALSGDPFDASGGFDFPESDGLAFAAMDHLLAAQAFTPVVSREEMAGFDFAGGRDEMRSEIASRVDAVGEYRDRFAEVFEEVESGAPIEYDHIARALAEFQITLVRADAPIDAFARGDTSALTPDQKRGAILFFGRGLCEECHSVRGAAREMFSDFDTHVIGVPQIVPSVTTSTFDGPGGDEDFGFERRSGKVADRYEFRSSPLRNVAFQPSFMHNGAYVCLDEAIRHHMSVYDALDGFSPDRLDAALQGPRGPDAPMLTRLHDHIRHPPALTDSELGWMIDFVENGLTDPDAHPDRLRALVPIAVPSGLPVHDFQFGAPGPECPQG